MNPNYNLVSNLGVIKDGTTGTDVKYLTGGIIDMTHLPEALYLNIGTNNYVQSVTGYASNADNYGNVTITLNFKGNSSTYFYKLIVNGVQISELSGGSSTTYSNTFGSGTYTIGCIVRTNGTGLGSTLTNNLLCSFTVGSLDSIGAPVVSLAGSFSINGTLKYISGIPYYTDGTTVTFPSNSLYITNIKNTITPSNMYVLATNTNSYTYNQVFGSTPLTLNMYNTNSLTTSLTAKTVSAKAYNVNFTSTSYATIISDIAYIASSFTEPTFNYDITTVQVSSLTLIGSTGFYYSPYASCWYSSPSFNRGTYKPTYTGTTTGGIVNFDIVSMLGFNVFVVNFVADSITNLLVEWGTGTVYDAKVIYNSGGCAGSTYSGGNRFPIQSPINRTVGETIHFSFTFATTLTSLSITNY